jgi:hypothetical protein
MSNASDSSKSSRLTSSISSSSINAIAARQVGEEGVAVDHVSSAHYGPTAVYQHLLAQRFNTITESKANLYWLVGSCGWETVADQLCAGLVLMVDGLPLYTATAECSLASLPTAAQKSILPSVQLEVALPVAKLVLAICARASLSALLGLNLDATVAARDLSPDSHPAMSTVGLSFEPVRLGAATGPDRYPPIARAAGPSLLDSDPTQNLEEFQGPQVTPYAHVGSGR